MQIYRSQWADVGARMKKVIVAFVSLLLCAVIAGCQSLTDSTTAPNTNSVPSSSLEEATSASQAGYWSKAASLWEQVVREHPDEALAHMQLSNAFSKLGRDKEAVEHSQIVVKIEPNNSGNWNGLCWKQILAGQFVEARASCEKALQLDPTHWGAIINLGHTWLLVGSLDKAKPYYKQALGYIPDQESLNTGPLADFDLFVSRDWERKLSLTAKEWLSAEALPYLEAEKLSFDAVDLYEKVQYEQGLNKARDASIRFEHLLGPDHPTVATSLNNLAELLKTIGRYAEAEPLCRRALAIDEKAQGPNHPAVSIDLNNLAVLLDDTGRYAEAEPLHRRALAIDEKARGANHPAVAIDLNNLALLLTTTGRYAEAEPLCRRALAIDEKAQGPNHPAVARDLNNLAVLLDDTGRYAEAEPLFWRAQEIDKNILGPDHPNVATDLNNLAGLLETSGRFAEAEDLYNQSLAILEKTYGRIHPLVSASLSNVGQLLLKLGHESQAEPLIERAYQIASISGEPELSFKVQRNLMKLHKKDNPNLALFYGKQAVNTLQSLRAGMSSTSRETQQAFTNSVSDTYHSLANLLIDQERLPEAEQVLAMLKEQEYFDFVRRDASADARETKANYNRSEAPWAARYAEIGGHLITLARERDELTRIHSDFRTPEQKARITQLNQDLNVGAAEVFNFLDEMKRSFQQQGGNKAVEFGEKELESLKMMQGVLASLHHDPVLIHYLVTPEHVRILLTVPSNPATPNTPGVQVHRDSTISKTELYDLIQRYRDVLTNPHQDPLPLAQKLYQALILPIQSDLDQAGAKTLMFSLDGNLRYLPMSALHNGKHWLAEEYAVALYTAAARSNLNQLPQVDWRVAGMGVSHGGTVGSEHFSPLPAVPQELAGIVRSTANKSGVLPGIQHMDADFTNESLINAISDGYPVLHLATHYHFAAGGTEAESFLLLGNEQKLTLSDIHRTEYAMNQVDLLTLSACETAMGTLSTGSEVEGLGTLAQKQGAKAVLATLWSVADASTGLFMRTLYEDRQQRKLTKAEALQQAQLAFINGTINSEQLPITLLQSKKIEAESVTQKTVPNGSAERIDSPTVTVYQTNPNAPFAHPFYWAPFVLMGNWL